MVELNGLAVVHVDAAPARNWDILSRACHDAKYAP
jgi:hypothetical protein